ncbi:helix-turn-helix domain-containing protein [Nocardia sp. ET3-3]|uniref:Helix-turn-helix domain-containing protein n=1 Tax=Nocardia terrae TaxID=2675851 RepID=A0A7K1UQQ9_9NOCA|nr:helix-turn-helix domain-containing protein [Nocardia terrae]
MDLVGVSAISSCCVSPGLPSLERVSEAGFMSSARAPGPTMQAYRFVLEPTSDQEEALRSHCGAARFVYNWGPTGVAELW